MIDVIAFIFIMAMFVTLAALFTSLILFIAGKKPIGKTFLKLSGIIFVGSIGFVLLSGIIYAALDM